MWATSVTFKESLFNLQSTDTLKVNFRTNLSTKCTKVMAKTTAKIQT